MIKNIINNNLWDQKNIKDLLVFDKIGPGHWRTRYGDPNLNGRSYGGQLLAQALFSGLKTVPEGRAPTMMHFLFLQGAYPDQPVDLRVSNLQEGKRFSSRHVRGIQRGNRAVLDAHVSAAESLTVPPPNMSRNSAFSCGLEEATPIKKVRRDLLEEIRALGGYGIDKKSSIEFRIPDPEVQLAPAEMSGRFKFWIRANSDLSDDMREHAAVFAYMSDWWFNFSALGLHLKNLDGRGIYIASLNHAIWFHRVFRADQWLYVDTSSPGSRQGRGIALGQAYDSDGQLLTTITQECLMAYS